MNEYMYVYNISGQPLSLQVGHGYHGFHNVGTLHIYDINLANSLSVYTYIYTYVIEME